MRRANVLFLPEPVPVCSKLSQELQSKLADAEAKAVEERLAADAKRMRLQHSGKMTDHNTVQSLTNHRVCMFIDSRCSLFDGAQMTNKA